MFSQSAELENIGNNFVNLNCNKNADFLINSIKAHKNIKKWVLCDTIISNENNLEIKKYSRNITLFLESFSILYVVQISFSSIFICSVVIGILYVSIEMCFKGSE